MTKVELVKVKIGKSGIGESGSWWKWQFESGIGECGNPQNKYQIVTLIPPNDPLQNLYS